MSKGKKKQTIKEIEKYEFVEEPVKQEEQVKEKKTVGNIPKIFVSIFLLIVFSVLAVMTLYRSFKVGELVNVRYQEKSDSTYKIIKEEQEVIKESELYEPTEIDSILINMDYEFHMNKETSLDFTSKVVGTIWILDKNNPKKVYYQESYDLLEEEQLKMNSSNTFTTSKEVLIDYENYNSIANKYSKSYDVETESYLEVTLEMNYKSNKYTNYIMEGESTPSIRIPLAKESIKIEENNINTEKRVNKKPDIFLENPIFLGISFLMSIGAILSLSYLILLLRYIIGKRDIYDRTVQKILRKYEKDIKEVSHMPSKRGKKIVRVQSFEELWKVKNRVNADILYNEIAEHTKCEFYLKESNKIYILTIKKEELEKKINN